MLYFINIFIGIVVLISVIVFFLGLFKLLFAKTDEQKKEGKKWMLWVSLLVLFIVASVAIVNISVQEKEEDIYTIPTSI